VSEQLSQKTREHDLYPSLIEFLKLELKVHSDRIDERRSSNSFGAGSNRWLYPDVVGMENLAEGLNPEVVSAIKVSSERRLRLWSFEVKILINRSNVRETYYQAVSNSSWANLGYLVAASIEGVDCPSADNLRLVRCFEKEGSGSSGLEFRRPAADAASVGLR